MPAAKAIGALRVVLGADTAAFDKGIRRSQNRMGSFASAMKRAGPIIGAAVGTAAVGLTVAIKNTIDKFDALAKTSQKIGIPVEELSRLTHAADLSGVSFETLTKGVQRLARTTVEANQGLKTYQRAFESIDVAWANADGTARNMEEIMADVADRFQQMPDGAEKTAVAMQLFGRAGAELIPLLNNGSIGMRELMMEADRLGIVVSTKSAKAAEEFNDNLNRLSKVGMSGLIAVTNAAAPTLADLSETILVTAEAVSSMMSKADELVKVIGTLTGKQEETDTFFARVRTAALRSIPVLGQVLSTLALIKGTMNLAGGEDKPDIGIGGGGIGILGASGSVEVDMNDELAESIERKAEAEREYQMLQAQGQSLVEASMTQNDRYLLALAEAGDAMRAYGATNEQIMRANEMIAEQYGATFGQVSTSIVGSMGDIASAFGGESKGMAKLGKAFGIVQATISMFVGASKALEMPFPANLAAMATVLGQGAALVGNIRSQNIPSGAHGGEFMVGGNPGMDNNLVAMNLSRGERVSVDTPGSMDRDASRTVVVNLKGRMFTYDDFRDFAEAFNRFAADGGTRLQVAR